MYRKYPHRTLCTTRTFPFSPPPSVNQVTAAATISNTPDKIALRFFRPNGAEIDDEDEALVGGRGEGGRIQSEGCASVCVGGGGLNSRYVD